MEPEDSLPYSQQRETRIYLERTESSPPCYFRINLIIYHFSKIRVYIQIVRLEICTHPLATSSFAATYLEVHPRPFDHYLVVGASFETPFYALSFIFLSLSSYYIKIFFYAPIFNLFPQGETPNLSPVQEATGRNTFVCQFQRI
jgi:hypothetical protein